MERIKRWSDREQHKVEGLGLNSFLLGTDGYHVKGEKADGLGSVLRYGDKKRLWGPDFTDYECNPPCLLIFSFQNLARYRRRSLSGRCG